MFDINVIATAILASINAVAPDAITLEEIQKMEIHSVSSDITLFIHAENGKFIIAAWNNDKQAVTSVFRCK